MRKKKITTRELILCALFAALTAVGAFIKIPAPPVPFTLQTLFVILSGLLLGSRLGAVSVSVYIFIGLTGVPVFTQGGGPQYVFQPTFGYMLGFIAAAFICGRVAENSQNNSFTAYFAGSLAGIMVIHILGMTYFYIIKNLYSHEQISLQVIFINCFLIFLPKDIASCLAASYLTKRLKPILFSSFFEKKEEKKLSN